MGGKTHLTSETRRPTTAMAGKVGGGHRLPLPSELSPGGACRAAAQGSQPRVPTDRVDVPQEDAGPNGTPVSHCPTQCERIRSPGCRRRYKWERSSLPTSVDARQSHGGGDV